MSARVGSTDFLARLRRTLTVTGVVVVASVAGACGDDDDDGTGPSADCIDEIDFANAFFDESDVSTIDVGGNRSGSLSASDPAIEGWFYDLYAIDIDDSGFVTISVDPEATLDADVALFYPDGGSEAGWYADEGFEGEAETLDIDVDAGCYVIGVSSFEAGATGSYTLSVD